VTVEPSPKLRIRNATVPGRWRIMFLDPTPLSPEWRARYLPKAQPSADPPEAPHPRSPGALGAPRPAGSTRGGGQPPAQIIPSGLLGDLTGRSRTSTEPGGRRPRTDLTAWRASSRSGAGHRLHQDAGAPRLLRDPVPRRSTSVVEDPVVLVVLVGWS